MSVDDASVDADEESPEDSVLLVDESFDDDAGVESELPHPTSIAATRLTLINVANTLFFIFCPPFDLK